jgi:glycine cleavage system aminomethyltransferase T
MKRSPLLHIHQKAGAQLGELHGWLLPLRYGPPAGRQSPLLADHSWITKIDVRGAARTQPPGGVALLPLGGFHGLLLCEPSALGAAEAWIAREQLSATDVTGGYACLLLMGTDATAILAKLTSADLRDSAFPSGSVTQSPVALAPGILWRDDRSGLPAYNVLIPRDYAESVWASLLHAGEEFDLAPIGVEDMHSL